MFFLKVLFQPKTISLNSHFNLVSMTLIKYIYKYQYWMFSQLYC